MSSKKLSENQFRETLQAINSFWMQWNNNPKFVLGLLFTKLNEQVGLLFTKLNEQVCVTVNNLNVCNHLVMTGDGNV